MTPPTHARNTLALDGVIDTGYVTTRAKPRRCRACNRPVIAGIDDLGIRVDVDPAPTTPLGELQAIVTGRTTHTVIAGRLVYRCGHRISSRDADTEPAYPAHACGVPLPTRPTQTRDLTAVPADAPPPF